LTGLGFANYSNQTFGKIESGLAALTSKLWMFGNSFIDSTVGGNVLAVNGTGLSNATAILLNQLLYFDSSTGGA
jgi:hypothetical protein